MCGIAGIVVKRSIEHQKPLYAMSDSIAHRGPDGKGHYFFENCAMSHRRLSIVDLENGLQPMLNAQEKVGVVFNGEIYGYQEIKTKEFPGYPFKTSSDTEVILALYEKYHIDFLSHLPGMFAFALWDDSEQTLICARDRFGEKPLFYAFGENGEFVFASEIKAILASNYVKPRLRKKSIAHYLQKLYVDPRHTIYENIFTLPPAHFIILKDGNITIKRYWSLPETNEKISAADAVHEFKRLLDNAVKKQLVADVSVGAFLSGGLDSSTIVALASQYENKLNTFSFAFKNGNNESSFARGIAKKYSSNHIELTDDNDLISDLLLKMQGIYDEPFADSSNIPTYLISKLAKRHTKVVLSGDGGDELLGGYGGYQALYFLQKKQSQMIWNNIAMWFISRVIARMPLYRRNYLLYRQIGANYARNFGSILSAQLQQEGLFSQYEISSLLSMSYEDEYKPSWAEVGTVEDAMRVDIEKYLPGDILVKTDRAAMASGLELRAPFLDKELASFCLQLPYQLKINKEIDKYILRESYQKMWTKAIRKRGKQGFGGPVNNWLQQKDMLDLRREYLQNKNKKIFSILPFDEVQKVTSAANHKSWSLLVLSLWLESNKYI